MTIDRPRADPADRVPQRRAAEPEARDDEGIDDGEGLPVIDGDDDVGSALEGTEAEIDEGSSESWLQAPEESEYGGAEIDELEEASHLGDELADVDDDPLEVDAETRWTEGSEAEGMLPIGEMEAGDETVVLTDDGAEGVEGESAEIEGSTERDASPAGDGEADDLAMGDAEGLDAQGEHRRDEHRAVAIAALEGELVEVHDDGLSIGGQRLSLDLGPGRALAGAVVLDEHRLLLWTTARSGHLVDTDGTVLAPIEGEVAGATSDGRGGTLIFDGDGEIRHLVVDDRTHLGLSRGPVIGALPGLLALVVVDPRSTVLYALLERDGGRTLVSVSGGAIQPLEPPETPRWIAADQGRLMIAGTHGLFALTEGGWQELATLPSQEPTTGLLRLGASRVVLSGGRCFTLPIKREDERDVKKPSKGPAPKGSG